MEVVKKAIEILAGRISENTTPDEALKYTQGALNLAHVVASFDNLKAAK